MWDSAHKPAILEYLEWFFKAIYDDLGDGLLLFYPHDSTKWDQYKFGYGWHLWRIFSCHLTVRYGESAKMRL